MRQNSGLAHCIYPDRHWGYCCNYQLEIEYLKKFESGKKQELQKKELYLKLFKLIPNKLVPGRESKEWKAYVKAGQKFWKSKLFCIKATETYNKVWQSYLTAKEALEKANIAYYKARDAYYSKYANELQILHDEMFPDCTWNGKTIFGEEY